MRHRYRIRHWNMPFVWALAINFGTWGIFAVAAYYLSPV
jgi:hypothetical protein